MISSVVRNNISAEVPKLLDRRFIPADAGAYLLDYGHGRLVLPARPSEYKFLRCQWARNTVFSSSSLARRYDGEEQMRGVVVRQVNGARAPAQPEDEADGDASIVPLNIALS
jgi:hypothetical protein